ncbi:MAG TPA: response regulator [Povalibacter sp.]|uniref:response regulator transcription factor n=1 Tax=Povalibacter sp. TaxID=1962978 RepID=UPI002C1650E3|nr:response regulator [Povalibacter sp.]HMN45616.1 response regulator [Povalibacter sp.]
MATSRGNIVIVEDDTGLNQAVSRLLQAAGFHVTSFESAIAALSSEISQQADCLVLDVHLPDMTGYELKKRLAAQGRSPPAIVITAHDDTHSRREADAIGAVAFLAKPFAGRVLVDEVARVIDGAGR